MDNVPPAITPSLGGLFDTDPDSPKLSIKDAVRTVNGALIWLNLSALIFRKRLDFYVVGTVILQFKIEVNKYNY
jgi:hypothetical protein